MIKVHYLRVLAALGIIFLAACTESSSSSSTDPDSDLAVTAVADFDVDEGETGNLSIADSAGSISTYAWTQVNAGSNSVSISGSNTKAASFTAPSDLAAVTELTFRITVSNSSDSKSDDVVVTVNNTEGPTVTASADSPVDEGTEGVALTSTASGASSYKWEQTNVGDYEVSISNESSASASFNAPAGLVDGNVTLSFQVTATDNDGNADTATVEVTVEDLAIPAIYDVSISNDNVVNSDDNLATVAYSGSTDSIYSSGTEAVTLVIGGAVQDTTSVNSDGGFSNTVDLSTLADGTFSVHVSYSYDDSIAEFNSTLVKDTDASANIDSVEVASGIYKVGDAVAVTITAEDNKTGLTLTSGVFNNRDLSDVVDNGDGTYTGTYTVVEGDDSYYGDNTDGYDSGTPNNLVGNVNLQFSDQYGNKGSAFPDITDVVALESSSLIDGTSPVITAVTVTTDADYFVGSDVPIAITVNADTVDDGNFELSSDSTFNGQGLSGFAYGATSSNVYTATYTVVEGDAAVAKGEILFADLTLIDPAGNESNAFTEVGLSASSIDTEKPSIYDVVFSGDNYINAADAHTIGGNDVTVTGKTYGIENGQKVDIVITVSGSDDIEIEAQVSNNSFTTTKDLSALSESMTPYSFNADVSNAAGTDADTFTGSILVDVTAPSISTFTPPSSAMGVGEQVISVNLSEAGSLVSGTFAGYALTGFELDSGTTYETTFTIKEGDANVAGTEDFAYTITVKDTAGNEYSQSGSVTGVSTDSIDADTPNIVIQSYNITVNEGSDVELNATTSTDVDSDEHTNGVDGDGNQVDTNGAISAGTYAWTQVDSDGTAYSGSNANANVLTKADGSALGSTDYLATFPSVEIPDDSGEDLNYYYVLTLTDDAGNEATSDVVSVTVTNSYVTPEITAVAGSAPNFNEVDLSWAATKDLDYELIRSTDSTCDPSNANGSGGCAEDAIYTTAGNEITISVDGSIASITDTVPDFHTTYYYWLEAYTATPELVSVSSVSVLATTSGPQLNDTGVVLGANYPSGFAADCNGGYTNDDGEFVAFVGEDCEFGRDADDDLNDDSDGHAGFSFTKLDANGNALSADATDWSCVLDNVTGLVWEVKLADGSIRDGSKTFTWWDGTSTTPPNVDTSQDTQDLRTHVNGENNGVGLCIRTDWRLPTAGELLSITNYSVDPDVSTAAVDSNYFPNMQGLERIYWTATTNANVGTTANAIWAYSNGSILSDGFAGDNTYSGHAILVSPSATTSIDTSSTEYLNSWVDARYADHTDGTVTDKYTGLMWMKCAYDNAVMLWDGAANDCIGAGYDDGGGVGNYTPNNTEGAVTYDKAFEQVASANAGNNNVGGYTDWRLPNVQELYSLLDHSAGDTNNDLVGSINATMFPDFRDGSGTSISSFWSSTPDASGEGKAYYVDFADDSSGTAVGSDFMNSSDAARRSILLVRDAN